MASKTQIVPKFQHPHVESYVYDNTIYTDTPNETVDESVKYLAVFRSSKGIDNTFVKVTNQKQFIEIFGRTNEKKYGQALLMPHDVLAENGATFNCMRIMPGDAKYAHSVVVAFVRVANDIEEGEGTTVQKYAKKQKTNDLDQPLYVQPDGTEGTTVTDTPVMVDDETKPLYIQDDGTEGTAPSGVLATETVRSKTGKAFQVMFKTLYFKAATKNTTKHNTRKQKTTTVGQEEKPLFYTSKGNEAYEGQKLTEGETLTSNKVWVTVSEDVAVTPYVISPDVDITKPERIELAVSKLFDGSDTTGYVELMKVVLGNTATNYILPNEDLNENEGKWKAIPVQYVYSSGRGVYGNNYSWRMTNDYNFEKDYSQIMYDFDIYEVNLGLSNTKRYAGSIVSSSVSGKSTLINDIISDADPADCPVIFNSLEDNIEYIYNDYVKFLTDKYANESDGSVEIPYLKEFNLYRGKNFATSSDGLMHTDYQIIDDPDTIELDSCDPKSETDGTNFDFYEKSVIVDGATETAKVLSCKVLDAIISSVDTSVTSNLGVPLLFGNDGSFDETVGGATRKISSDRELEIICNNPKAVNEMCNNNWFHLEASESTEEDANDPERWWEKHYTSTYEEIALIEAFLGYLDSRILSPRRIPADALFDSNYPYFAKRALYQLAVFRDDAVLYLDCGTDMSSFSEANIATLENRYMIPFENRIVSKNVQWYEVRDPYSFKKLKVTTTYWLALNVCRNFKENGLETPLACARARVSDHIRNSFKPAIDLHETDLKETLNNDRFNYWEAIDEYTYQRSTQNTAQDYNSDLLEESNMHVLFWLKRHVEDDCLNNLYNFANAAERQAFTTVEQAKYEHLIGKELYSFNIRFDMNEWEAERSIIHCYIEIQFRTINKRAIIEIDVNKRNFNA